MNRDKILRKLERTTENLENSLNYIQEVQELVSRKTKSNKEIVTLYCEIEEELVNLISKNNELFELIEEEEE